LRKPQYRRLGGFTTSTTIRSSAPRFVGTIGPGLAIRRRRLDPRTPAHPTSCCANVNTGAFEVYDIANNQITGAAALGSVGLDWQLGRLCCRCADLILGRLRRLNRSARAGNG